MTPLEEGQELRAVNTVGGLAADLGRVNSLLAPFLPVGFYYKSFHKPAWLFPYWERFIRQAAGLGYVTPDDERRRWGKGYGFADVLVVGAGPSGLAAAATAGEAGARVVLVDENPRPGGTLTYARDANGGGGILEGLLDRIQENPNVELWPSTVASAHFEDHWIPLVSMERGMTKMRVKSVVVAGGAMEQPAVFRNNDLPGVMLGSAAQRLIQRHAVKPFDRGVVLAANADAYGVVLDLIDAGVEVVAVADLRPEGEQSELGDAVREAGVEVYPGHCVYEAKRRKNGASVGGAVIAPLDAQNNPIMSRAFGVACDGICMSVGWAANAALLAQAGCRLAYSEDLHQFVPEELAAGIFAAGRVNGVYLAEDKVRDGERAGLLAARHLGRGEGDAAPEEVSRHSGARSHPYPVYDHPKGMAFVDLDEDVQLKDIKNSIQEGFDSIALVNRYATLGMGPSQGKHSNTNGIRIVARLMNRTVAETGAITSRPFFHPVPMGILGGRSFHPTRRSPVHRRHEELGAVFMRAGDWFRPEYYATPGESRDEAILSEVRAVRTGLGLIDVGTLGKLEVAGPDALELVERICTGRFAKLKVGMTRYALMTDEAGIITDDGVCARLADDRFYLTATTSGVAALYREMTRWAWIWDLDVEVTNYSNAFAAMNLAGPRSREALSGLTDLDLSEEAFPYLGVRDGEVAGVPARVMRVGFVGELGYEVHVPADGGLHVWDRISEAGKAFGVKPFGVEAQRRLRLEKGHIIVGQDTDGLTNPWEAEHGLGRQARQAFLRWPAHPEDPAEEGRGARTAGGRGPTPDRPADARPQARRFYPGGWRGIHAQGVPPRHRGRRDHRPGHQHRLQRDPGQDHRAGVLARRRRGRVEVRDPGRRRRDGGGRGGPHPVLRPRQRAPESPPERARLRGRQGVTGRTATRRSPVHDALERLSPRWGQIGPTPTALSFGDPEGEAALKERLAICDVSALPRFGVKGPNASGWLESQGIDVPEAANAWSQLSDGRGLVARLGSSEFLVEDGPDGSAVEGLGGSLNSGSRGVYPVLRQDAAFVLAGERSGEVMRQVCGIDFDAVEPGARPVFLTRVATISAVVLPRVEDDVRVFRLWCSYPYGSYLWEELGEIVGEYGGGVVGLSAVYGGVREV